MTATASPIEQPLQDEQLEIFFLMHRSMRQDASALVAALERIDVDDRGTARTLSQWFTAFAAGIVHHHSVEDDIFWPALTAASTDFAEAAEILEADHHRLDEVMAAMAGALADLTLVGRDRAADLARAVACATELEAVLRIHLDREEAAAIPAMRACLSGARYDELSEEATKEGGVAAMAWIVPWVLDHATEEEAARGVATLPAPVRWLNSLVWSRRYLRLAAPVRAARGRGDRGVRDGRRRPVRLVARTAPLLALLVLVAAVFAGCGGDDAGASGTTTELAELPTAPPASEVTITATEYTFEPSARRIAAGRVRLTLDNRGEEPHQVQLGLVEPGTTADSFYRTFHEQGPGAAEKLLRWQTGVNGVEPGEKGTVVGDLQPGQYLMICFVPGHDGVSHIDKKMIVPVEVVPGGEPVAEPAAEGEIVLEDYAIDIPGGFDGSGTFAVRNSGPADHELILMRYEPGKTLADLVAWSDGGMKGTPPITYTSGVGTIPHGETSWVDLDLDPGAYIALCVITGPTGQPHALMGMTAEFEIG